jgi:hypothetical protein
VAGGAWATNPDSVGDPQGLPPFFLSSPAMTCKQEKHKQRFRFFFRSASPPFLFQICFTADPSLVSVFFSFASGGWRWDQEAAGLWVSVRSAGRRCCSVSAAVEGWPARAESTADRLNEMTRSRVVLAGFSSWR